MCVSVLEKMSDIQSDGMKKIQDGHASSPAGEAEALEDGETNYDKRGSVH